MMFSANVIENQGNDFIIERVYLPLFFLMGVHKMGGGVVGRGLLTPG